MPVVASLGLVVLTGAACGGGSASGGSASSGAVSSASSVSAAAASAGTGSSATATSTSAASTAAPIRARLIGHNHHPVVGRPWPFTVTVRSPAGRPLSGRVEIEFTFAGEVVGTDTPPVHPLRDGRWREQLTFPAEAAGRPLDVQAVVHTRHGSATLDWPVVVRQ